MMTSTPAKPVNSPATATAGSRCPRKVQPSAATQSGSALARIAASPASIVCIAKWKSPR